jgi:hypothetical protein
MQPAIVISATLVLHATLFAEVRWDSGNATLIQEGGHYGRIARLDQKTLIAAFDYHRSIHIRRSHDQGKTWQPPIKVAEARRGTDTNTELCVLKGGQVLCFFNFRPDKNSGLRYAIAMSGSSDRGLTWSETRTIYQAGAEFGNGCWEPVCIQLPDESLQLYFANENPYPRSDEQEISLMRSNDQGITWSGTERVSFRKNHRDGMPVPVLAADLGRIFMAIEDNGLNGTFKPVIISTSLKQSGSVDGSNPDRWSALSRPLAHQVYAGAPYLRRFPDGTFILSYQMAESGNMKESRMAVSLGNQQARDFEVPTFPFPDASDIPQLWNSLFIKNAHTVTAISETTHQGIRGIWAVDGVLKR